MSKSPSPIPNLNQTAARALERLAQRAADLRVGVHRLSDGSFLVDAGVDATGGVQAGLELARICLSDLGSVEVGAGALLGGSCPEITVQTDHPVAACMASQYAGWQVSVGNFFAMASGPMRAAYAGEELFSSLEASGLNYRQATDRVVGVLESAALPGEDVFSFIAEKAGVEKGAVSLAVAPTRSLAGGVQVVARSVETALHKLHTLGFDLNLVVSGMGSAPLPPPGRNDLRALGRTNDAILYGGRVTLWVDTEDATLEAIGPEVPSSSSKDYGTPFYETFTRYERDFYKIDPHLFSPAQITFQNLASGRSHTFGAVNQDVLSLSFFD